MVTFVSDRVVEARDANGELLGFDRMGALTAKPAEEVADAAQQPGRRHHGADRDANCCATASVRM